MKKPFETWTLTLRKLGYRITPRHIERTRAQATPLHLEALETRQMLAGGGGGPSFSVGNVHLLNDTGVSDVDLITSDPTVTGSVTGTPPATGTARLEFDHYGNGSTDYVLTVNVGNTFVYDPSDFDSSITLSTGSFEVKYRPVEYNDLDVPVTFGSWSSFTYTIQADPVSSVVVRDQGGAQLVDGVSVLQLGTMQEDTSVNHTLTIENAGTSVLTLSNLDLTNAVTVVSSFSSTVAVGASTSLTVQIAPTMPGIFGGHISFATNDPDHPVFDIDVSAVVNEAVATIAIRNSAGTVIENHVGDFEFEVTEVGSPLSETFTLENVGNLAIGLDLNSIELPSGITLVSPPGASISAGGQTTFVLQLDASQTRFAFGDVRIRTTDPEEPIVLFGIEGRVVEAFTPIEIFDVALFNDNGINEEDGITDDPRIIGRVVGDLRGGYVDVEFNHGQDNVVDGDGEIRWSGMAFWYDPRLTDPGFAQTAGAKTLRYRHVLRRSSGDIRETGAWQSFSFELTAPESDPPIVTFAVDQTPIGAEDVIQFGTLVVGGQATKTITVSNVSGSPLTIEQIALPFGFEQVLAGYPAPIVIGAGQSATIDVRMDGLIEGEFSGQMVLDISGYGGTLPMVALAGNVEPIQIQLWLGGDDLMASEGRIDFGTIAAGGSTDKTLELKNVGAATLELSQDLGLPIGVTLAAPLSSLALAPNESATFTLRFSPPTTGQHSGFVSINAAGVFTPIASVVSYGEVDTSRLQLSIDGASIAAGAEIVAFGTVLVGSSFSRVLRLENSGVCDIVLTAIDVPDGFEIVEGTVPVTLSPTQSAEFEIALTGENPGLWEGDIVVATDDPSRAEIRLSALGMVLAAPALTLLSDNGAPLDQLSSDPRVVVALAPDLFELFEEEVFLEVDTDGDQAADAVVPISGSQVIHDPLPEPGPFSLAARVRIENQVNSLIYFSAWTSFSGQYDPDLEDAPPLLTSFSVSEGDETYSSTDYVWPVLSGQVGNDGQLFGMSVAFDFDQDGVFDGVVPVEADGSFRFESFFLPPGEYTVSAVVAEVLYSGEVQSSQPGSLTYTVVAPPTPSVFELHLLHDTGASSSDGITSVAAIGGSLAGVAVDQRFIAVWDANGDEYPDGSAVVDGQGHFEFEPYCATTGLKTVSVKIYDLQWGIGGEWTDIEFTLVSTETPTVATMGLLHDTGASSSDGITSDPTLIGSLDEVWDGDHYLIQFDVNGDQVVDDSSLTNLQGDFLYIPQDLPFGSVTVAYRTSILDNITQQVVFSNWSTFAFVFESSVDLTIDGLQLADDDGPLPDDNQTTDATIEGTVLDAGEFSPNTQVEIDENGDLIADASVLSDELGRFSHLVRAAPGNLTVNVRGRAIDSANGQPVYGAWISLSFVLLPRSEVIPSQYATMDSIAESSRDFTEALGSQLSLGITAASQVVGNHDPAHQVGRPAGFAVGPIFVSPGLAASLFGVGRLDTLSFQNEGMTYTNKSPLTLLAGAPALPSAGSFSANIYSTEIGIPGTLVYSYTVDTVNNRYLFDFTLDFTFTAWNASTASLHGTLTIFSATPDFDDPQTFSYVETMSVDSPLPIGQFGAGALFSQTLSITAGAYAVEVDGPQLAFELVRGETNDLEVHQNEDHAEVSGDRTDTTTGFGTVGHLADYSETTDFVVRPSGVTVSSSSFSWDSSGTYDHQYTIVTQIDDQIGLSHTVGTITTTVSEYYEFTTLEQGSIAYSGGQAVYSGTFSTSISMVHSTDRTGTATTTSSNLNTLATTEYGSTAANADSGTYAASGTFTLEDGEYLIDGSFSYSATSTRSATASADGSVETTYTGATHAVTHSLALTNEGGSTTTQSGTFSKSLLLWVDATTVVHAFADSITDIASQTVYSSPTHSSTVVSTVNIDFTSTKDVNSHFVGDEYAFVDTGSYTSTSATTTTLDGSYVHAYADHVDFEVDPITPRSGQTPVVTMGPLVAATLLTGTNSGGSHSLATTATTETGTYARTPTSTQVLGSYHLDETTTYNSSVSTDLTYSQQATEGSWSLHVELSASSQGSQIYTDNGQFSRPYLEDEFLLPYQNQAATSSGSFSTHRISSGTTSSILTTTMNLSSEELSHATYDRDQAAATVDVVYDDFGTHSSAGTGRTTTTTFTQTTDATSNQTLTAWTEMTSEPQPSALNKVPKFQRTDASVTSQATSESEANGTTTEVISSSASPAVTSDVTTTTAESSAGTIAHSSFTWLHSGRIFGVLTTVEYAEQEDAIRHSTADFSGETVTTDFERDTTTTTDETSSFSEPVPLDASGVAGQAFSDGHSHSVETKHQVGTTLENCGPAGNPTGSRESTIAYHLERTADSISTSGFIGTVLLVRGSSLTVGMIHSRSQSRDVAHRIEDGTTEWVDGQDSTIGTFSQEQTSRNLIVDNSDITIRLGNWSHIRTTETSLTQSKGYQEDRNGEFTQAGSTYESHGDRSASTTSHGCDLPEGRLAGCFLGVRGFGGL